MNRLFFDLETDGLDPDVIHCIALGNPDTGEVWSYNPREIRMGLKELQEADEIIGHNIIGYDLPVIKKLYPKWSSDAKVTDTLVLSRMIKADLKNEDFDKNWAVDVLPKRLFGSHGLEAWGIRLDLHKGDFGKTTDWSEWSQEMQDYCEQDVAVCMKLYEYLNPQSQPEEALNLVHEITRVAENIGKAGWTFDKNAAADLYGVLAARRAEIENELQDMFEPWYVETEFIPKRNNKTLGYEKDVPVIKRTEVKFNHNSRRHIEFCLRRKYNWKPKKMTPQGHAIIDDVVLGDLDYPEAQKLSELFLIQKRIGQLAEGPQAWLKKVDKDGKLRHRIQALGTVTHRAAHISPNLGQVPATRLKYGKECRSLFTVPRGYSLVGSDLSGLEIRCFAHYTNDKEYTRQILEGDIHSYNQSLVGLQTRDQAKTWLYATLYGAGDGRIGQVVGKGAAEGRKLKENFMKGMPAFARLKKAVERAAERGHIKSLDGRTIKVRSPHAALNTLLQSTGSIICAKWVTLLDNKIKEEGLDATIIAWVHDEVQIAVREGQEEDVGNLARRMAQEAGEAYKFRIPIDAEYAIGRTWADTH